MTVKPRVNYAELIDEAARRCAPVTETPRLDAEVLLQHILNKPRAWLLAHGDQTAAEEQQRAFYRLVERRQRGEPVAYITGYREFWSLNLRVTPDVLIPRPDTETLVELALQRVSREQQVRILDLGTGSGAIALALATELPHAEVLAVDISDTALAVAKLNAERLSLQNIRFQNSDWFSRLEPQFFHLIAANPPYVKAADPHLQRGDLRFEPDLALTSGEHGYKDIRCIITTAPIFLERGGLLLVEHGYDQADDVGAMFLQAGFTDMFLAHDLHGLPRCTLGVWPGG